MTEELSKTAAGRTRIGAAAERLDRTVEELGQQFRDDVPQGEKEAMVQPRSELTVPQTLEFLPLNAEETTQHIPIGMDDESRVVLPSPDEPGGGETREFGGEASAAEPPAHEDSMDVNVVQDKPETEMNTLMSLLHRDEKIQVEDATREILAVIRSLGGDRGKYKRERASALKAVVSEIYSPPRVTAASKLLPELRLMPGFALDLTTADDDGALWDFDSKVMRDRAMKKVRGEATAAHWLSHVHRVLHVAAY